MIMQGAPTPWPKELVEHDREWNRRVISHAEWNETGDCAKCGQAADQPMAYCSAPTVEAKP